MKQNELFNENALDHIIEVLHKIKTDIADMEEPLKSEKGNLQEITATLNEIRDIISAFDQPELFVNTSAFESSDDFEQLEELIGTDNVNKVIAAFAGSNIYIPKSYLTTQNYQAIRKEYKDGAKYRDLSIKYGYSETHIRNIIHKKKAQ